MKRHEEMGPTSIEARPKGRVSTRGKDNIVLIGMPGSGKSTVGVILAKLTSRGFIDTDLLIQSAERRRLQEIVDRDGFMALRTIEEKVLLGLDCDHQVIATGGSAVYSETAMIHLKGLGIIVFLDVDLPTLISRIDDFENRGLARAPGQTLSDLFRERRPFYLKYADVVLRASCGLSHEEVCDRIIKSLDGE